MSAHLVHSALLLVGSLPQKNEGNHLIARDSRNLLDLFLYHVRSPLARR